MLSITAANRADIRVVEELVHDLKAIPEHVREKAAETLGELGDSRAVTALVEALLTDESVYVRERAAYALGRLGDGRASEPLIQALRDQSEYVRREVVQALGKLGYYRVVEPLIEAILQDESACVRERAAEIVETLIEALKKIRQRYVHEAVEGA